MRAAERQLELARLMAENFVFWGKMTGFPKAEIVVSLPDRVFFEWRQEHYEWCCSNMEEWRMGIEQHAKQFRDSATAVDGWREPVAFGSAQIIWHRTRSGDLGEWDVDVGNPAFGLLPLVIHIGEFVYHRLPLLVGAAKRFVGPRVVRKLWARRGWPVDLIGQQDSIRKVEEVETDENSV